MNRHQFALKTIILVLGLNNDTVSFGMIVRDKDEQHKKRVQANCQQTVSQMNDMCIFHKFEELSLDMKMEIINHLDNPIIFGQANKVNHGLVKSLGLQNLRLVYQKQDPNFVLNHYVPILSVRVRSELKDESDEYLFGAISPYHITFYHSGSENDNDKLEYYDVTSHRENDYMLGEDIRSLGQKRLQQFKEQKEKQYKKVNVDPFGRDIFSTLIENRKLTLDALFGSKKDIENTLQGNVICRSFLHYPRNQITEAMKALISNPDIDNDNNALETLFKDPRAFLLCNGYTYYCLLDLSRQMNNKKAFRVLVTEDIYDSKNMLWCAKEGINGCKHCAKDSCEPRTALDFVIKHNKMYINNSKLGSFSEQDIALLKEHGAKTAFELNVNTTQDRYSERNEKP